MRMWNPLHEPGLHIPLLDPVTPHGDGAKLVVTLRADTVHGGRKKVFQYQDVQENDYKCSGKHTSTISLGSLQIQVFRHISAVP
jgi:hypothetical protein